MKILLVTPPMTQINAPYPATAHLMGALKLQGHEVIQRDFSIELALRLFSKQTIAAISKKELSSYADTIEAVLEFLRGKDPSLAWRIVRRDWLPEGPAFKAAIQTDFDSNSHRWAFGELGLTDYARYLASLYIDDFASLIRGHLDKRFELSRFAFELAVKARRFRVIEKALNATPTYVDRIIDDLTEVAISERCPDQVWITIPFPGCLYGAFRVAKRVKELSKATQVIIGGAFVDTELRHVTSKQVSKYVDKISLDAGEDPQLQAGLPTYEGLNLDSYISLFEMLNPVIRLWSDCRWNKLQLARGCYWHKCNFCDTSLKHICSYKPVKLELLLKRIETLVEETEQTGFHFVDEAAPPALLKKMASALIEKRKTITWWGNIRFEKSFIEQAELLAQSGCVAVTGGIEAATPRLLKLVNKGVTLQDIVRVTGSLSRAGILVHSYLMFGLPTQTLQETIDALEFVRQLFKANCIQSAFWHRFSATAHSPIGLSPKAYGIKLHKPVSDFIYNDIPFTEIVPNPIDYSSIEQGLKSATYNYMHGIGLDDDVRTWFKNIEMPNASLKQDFVSSIK